MSAVTDRLLETEWTVESLAEAGVIDLPGWELLDGRLRKRKSQTFPVYHSATCLREALEEAFAPDEWRVYKGAPVRLDDRSEPQPDVSVVSRIATRERRTAWADEARLVVEVCHTTHADDFGTRLPRYARAGIREYWVVDVCADVVLHVYTEPDGDGYLRHHIIGGEDEVPYVSCPLRTLLSPDVEKA